MAEFLNHQFGGVGVEGLGNRRHHAHLHQGLDDLGRAGGHAVREFLHGDLFRQDDVAHDLHLIGSQPVEFLLTAFAFALTAHRGQRADLFVLTLDRRLNVDPAGSAAIVGAALGGDDRWLAGRNAARASAADRASVIFVLGPSGTQPQRLGRGGGGLLRRCRRAAGGRLGDRLGRLLLRRRWWRRCRLHGFLGGVRAVGSACGRRRGGGGIRGALGLGLDFLANGLLFGSARLFLGGLAGFGFASARFLGGGEDRDRLLLAPFRFAPGGVALLLNQGALASGLFGGGQCASGARRAGGPAEPVPRGAGAMPAGGGGGAPAAAEGFRATGGVRVLRTSTCTTFDRPWLKLCRTEPASTVRPSSKRPAGRRESRPLPPS